MGKDKKQTTTQRLDPASQRYVSGTRSLAGRLTSDIMNAGPLTAELQGTPQEWMSHFMNPYIDQVIGGVGQQYDLARGRAGVMGNQAATGVAGNAAEAAV